MISCQSLCQLASGDCSRSWPSWDMTSRNTEAQEIVNRVPAAQRNSEAQLVEARTKAEVEEIQAKTRAEAKRRGPRPTPWFGGYNWRPRRRPPG